MFYSQFLKICKAKGVKPTPLVKSLGLSTGNLKKWADGATVNSDILAMLSDYFKVPVDYFFGDDEPPFEDEINKEMSLKMTLNALKAHPDYIASLTNGTDLSVRDLLKISKYLKRNPSYLYEKEIPDSISEDGYGVPARDIIIGILTKLPATDEYRALQVRISTIIIENLSAKKITKDDLIGIKLAEKKMNDLYDLSIPAEKKKGLNISDLVRISEAFNVSYDYMLTGDENSLKV